MKHIALILFTISYALLSAQDYLELSRVDSLIYKLKVAEVQVERKSIKEDEPDTKEVYKYNEDGALIYKETQKKGEPTTNGTFTYENGRLVHSIQLRSITIDGNWDIETVRELYTYNSKSDTVYVWKYTHKVSTMAIEDVPELYAIKTIKRNENGNIIFLREEQIGYTGFAQYEYTYDFLKREITNTYTHQVNDSSYYISTRRNEYSKADNIMKTVTETNRNGKITKAVWTYTLNKKGKIEAGRDKDGTTMENIFYENGLLKQSSYTSNGKQGWIKKHYVYRD